MRLKDHIDRSLIFTDLHPPDKPSLLKTLVDKATACLTGIDGAQLLSRLMEREEEGSTGIGQGIAIPHTTVDNLDRTACLLAQIPDGVDYDSIDQEKVYFVFLLLSPSNAVGEYIRLLARISRVASRQQFVREVCEADGPEAIYGLVVQEDDRHVE